MISPRLLDFSKLNTEVVEFSVAIVTAELFGALDLTRSAHDAGLSLGAGNASGSGFWSVCSTGAETSTSSFCLEPSTAPFSGVSCASDGVSLDWGEAFGPTGTTGTTARMGTLGVKIALGTADTDEGVVGCVESVS